MTDQPARPPEPARPPDADREPAFHGAAHGAGAGAGGSILLPDMPLPERQTGQAGIGAAQPAGPGNQQGDQR